MSSRAHVFTCLALLLFASTMNAQPAGTSQPSDLAKVLTFETDLWTRSARPQGRWTPTRSAGAQTAHRRHRQ